nr:MAG TPA: hypothetical protein [Caudoviricetes sp.]
MFFLIKYYILCFLYLPSQTSTISCFSAKTP